jgi:DNA-binding beta-propeller fold protein YncE
MGETGSKAGQLFQPTNLTLAPDGSLYVVDTGNFRIQQFSPDGEFIRAFGRIGTGAGTFSRPKGIALDHGGRFYVVDAAFENVQILDQTGAALMFFGAPGGERDSINLPTVVKIDYDNVEYFQEFVADGFDVEYLVIVASQFGLNKVVVFGFGSARE